MPNKRGRVLRTRGTLGMSDEKAKAIIEDFKQILELLKSELPHVQEPYLYQPAAILARPHATSDRE